MRRILAFVILLSSFTGIAKSHDELNDPTDNELSGKLDFVIKIPTTEVKDQHKTSTCWSFSGISLMETELIRMDKGEYDLSEMFIVRQSYQKKAERFIRMHGKTNFAPGGEVNDVTDVFDEYGIVPENAYSGLQRNETQHRHNEMDRVLENYVEALISENNQEITPLWREGFAKVLDSYLGKFPETFEYEGQTYSPKSFAEELGIDPGNYVMITSFIHEAFYKPIILEIPDNWSWAESYNVPLEVLEEIVDSAISRGYSVSWAADISETGFNFSKGMAVAPRICYVENEGKEQKKWNKLSEKEKEERMFSLSSPIEEIEVTPDIRQEAFDNHNTTDDHGMHIVGMATDRNHRSFYYVKNSWGDDNPFDGYILVSKPYFQFKTISVMVHKEALPSLIREKLNL